MGQVGDGTTTQRNEPTAVVGEVEFETISVRMNHACGLTAAGVAYCWGYNDTGQLGTGSATSTSTPVPIAGGLTFSLISAGTDHACGLTPDQVAYCWGYGQAYGNPAEEFADEPRKVVGQP